MNAPSKRVRVPRPKSPPMLISRGLRNDEIEMTERQHVEAFAGGWATTEHYDYLANMRDCLMLAAAMKDDASALAMARAAGVALLNIRGHYETHQRMAATTDEIAMLREFVTFFRDYWLRQPLKAYEEACETLGRARAMGSLEVPVNGRKEVSHAA